jgi:hypothetical protein
VRRSENWRPCEVKLSVRGASGRGGDLDDTESTSTTSGEDERRFRVFVSIVDGPLSVMS